MNTLNEIRDGFWTKTQEATARHEGGKDGTVPTEALDSARDGERLARLSSDDGLAFQRVSGGGRQVEVSYLQEGLDVARTVALIRVTDRMGRETGAVTGVMVSPRLLMTVGHALPNRDVAARSTVWFDYERDENGIAKAPRIFRLEPEEFFYTDASLDITLVAVEEVGHDGTSVTELGSVVLIDETPKVGSKELLHVVQHPQGGFKQVGLHCAHMTTLFEDFAHFGPAEPVTCGAAVFNDQWELVGIVHAAVAESIPESEETAEWIGFEGVRVSRICEVLLDELWTEEEQDFIDEVFEDELDEFDDDPFDEAVMDDEDDLVVGEGDHEGEPMTPAPATLEAYVPHIEAEMPVPPIDLGQVPPPLPAAMEELPPEPEPTRDPEPEIPPEVQPIPEPTPDVVPEPGIEVPEVPKEPDLVPIPEPEIVPPVEPEPSHEPVRGAAASLYDGPVAEEYGLYVGTFAATAYAHLTGFDEKFLGDRTPLPRMLPNLKQQVAKSSQGVEVLDYSHFSIVVNGRRRTAFFVAANVDASQSRRTDPDSVWLFDSRLDRASQLGPEPFSNTTLSHILWTTPDEVGWGDKAERAATDAHHFTNSAFCPPVAQTDLWRGLVKEAVGQGRACVYSGPVMQPGDPVFKGVQVPMELWRIIVTAGLDGKLVARGFRQARKAGTDEFETLQCRVSEIESVTGLDFGPLRLSDPMGHLEGNGRVIGRLSEVNA
jgi:endonuclease G